MGLLERARLLHNSAAESAHKKQIVWQAAQTKKAQKEAARILEVDEKEIHLIEKDYAWYFTLEDINFKVTWSHRGYDNLGGGMFWELYIKVGGTKFYVNHQREERGQWFEVKQLIDIVKLVDLYGL